MSAETESQQTDGAKGSGQNSLTVTDNRTGKTYELEITNLTRIPIKLYPGLPIAQLSFMALDAPAERPYGHPDLGSHYQGQVEATESRYGAQAGKVG